MERLKNCRLVQTLCRVGRRADRVVNKILIIPSVLTVLSVSVVSMHMYLILVLCGYIQPSYDKLEDSTSMLSSLLHLVLILAYVCKSRVEATLLEETRAVVEEQDVNIADLKATINEQDTTIVDMKGGNKQEEDINVLKDMIIARERDFAQKFGSDRNLELNAPFNGKGGLQIDPAIQAHRELVNMRMELNQMKIKAFLNGHETRIERERKKTKSLIDEFRRELNGRLRQTP